MADQPSVAELLARVQQLELAQARHAARSAVITYTTTAHEPRPGTWVGDGTEAECRYCGQRVWRDEAHRWLYGRDPHCQARAAGAQARD